MRLIVSPYSRALETDEFASYLPELNSVKVVSPERGIEPQQRSSKEFPEKLSGVETIPIQRKSMLHPSGPSQLLYNVPRSDYV